MRYTAAVNDFLIRLFIIVAMMSMPVIAAGQDGAQKPEKETPRKTAKKKAEKKDEAKPAEDNDIKYQEWLRQQEIQKAAQEKSKKDKADSKKQVKKEGSKDKGATGEAQKNNTVKEAKKESPDKQEKDALTKIPEKSELQKQMDAEEKRLREEDAKHKSKKATDSREDEEVPQIPAKQEPGKQQHDSVAPKEKETGKKVAKKEPELKKENVLMPEKCVPESNSDKVKVIPVTEVFFKLKDRNTIWIPVGSSHGLKKGDKFYVCRDIGKNHFYPVTEVEVTDLWSDAVTAKPLAQFDHDKAESYGIRENDVIIFREEVRIVQPEKKKRLGGKGGGQKGKKTKKKELSASLEKKAAATVQQDQEKDGAPCRVVDTKDGYNRNMLPEMKEDLLRFVPPKGEEKKKEIETKIEIKEKKPADSEKHSFNRALIKNKHLTLISGAQKHCVGVAGG